MSTTPGAGGQSADMATANAAFQAFEAKNYRGAVESLKSLSKQKAGGSDLKIQHNVAISEFLAAGGADIAGLLVSLENIREQMESAGSGESKAPVMDDVERAILSFNIALLQFQTKQFTSSSVLLESLFRKIEPLDEYLGLKVCTLLLDCYLQPMARLSANPASPGSARASMEANGAGSASGDQDLSADEADYAAGGGASASFDSVPRLVTSYEFERAEAVIAYLEKAYASQLSTLPPLDEVRANKAPLAKSGPGGMSPQELQILLLTYKSKLHLAMKTFRTAKRDIKQLAIALQNISKNSVTAAFLKAHVEYERLNHRKAFKLLSSLEPPSDDSGFTLLNDNANLNSIVWNDLGIVHIRMGRTNAALFYFTKALEANDAAAKSVAAQSGRKGKNAPDAHGKSSFAQIGQDRRCEIAYNAGMAFLLSGKPERAFISFREAQPLFATQARYWLRMAECCIARHVMAESGRAHATKSPVVTSLVGSGPQRLLLLPTRQPATAPATGAGAATGPAAFHPDGQLPIGKEMTLVFAARALGTAHALLNTTRAVGSNGIRAVAAAKRKEAPSADDDLDAGASDIAADPSTHMAGGGAALRHAVLLARAYVALCLENPLTAVGAAESLLYDVEAALRVNDPKLAHIVFLAHTYAAEGLLQLGRFDDALAHLSPAVLNNTGLIEPVALNTMEGGASANAYPPFYTTSDGIISSGNHVGAKTVFYVNLAAAFILQGRSGDAIQAARQAQTLAPAAPSVVLLCAYLHLRSDNPTLALDVLKRHRAPVFGT